MAQYTTNTLKLNGSLVTAVGLQNMNLDLNKIIINNTYEWVKNSGTPAPVDPNLGIYIGASAETATFLDWWNSTGRIDNGYNNIFYPNYRTEHYRQVYPYFYVNGPMMLLLKYREGEPEFECDIQEEVSGNIHRADIHQAVIEGYGILIYNNEYYRQHDQRNNVSDGIINLNISNNNGQQDVIKLYGTHKNTAQVTILRNGYKTKVIRIPACGAIGKESIVSQIFDSSEYKYRFIYPQEYADNRLHYELNELSPETYSYGRQHLSSYNFGNSQIRAMSNSGYNSETSILRGYYNFEFDKFESNVNNWPVEIIIDWDIKINNTGNYIDFPMIYQVGNFVIGQITLVQEYASDYRVYSYDNAINFDFETCGNDAEGRFLKFWNWDNAQQCEIDAEQNISENEGINNSSKSFEFVFQYGSTYEMDSKSTKVIGANHWVAIPNNSNFNNRFNVNKNGSVTEVTIDNLKWGNQPYKIYYVGQNSTITIQRK